ncbi:UDP-glucose/GDP-mannose dehydrogenase family protein [Actinosynnema sp. NPDC047251]|uniref:UDP-glucose 6-dehydrogenase n=1 Tax=Saccharothrix espanaensis (strain ATCC 51144 / DSM 44229 / JCM 9112 / NBRC 15066 / NRRL 15764) TaxID=1179773 RepID=K0K609_SACES|nr:UDP-glucose/GDP-mannose dehydrogenase family protein [Saccharothrix espanaensis]CCH32319.1 UDP-glucose 6-dehydrogenase [Saccharothrix espanaensis DSM 44229]
MARIGVIGAGYVGLTTAACFAELGHDVVCADVDETRVRALNRAEISALEPGLTALVQRGLATGRLRFVRGNREPLSGSEFVFLCVPTPTGEDGAADLTQVRSVLREADLLPPDCVLVLKSTVPPGTADAIADSVDVPVVSNPEFLREGHAVEDFLRPQRIVVGGPAARQVSRLYRGTEAPVVVTSNVGAELVKYASNCFLAVKLSYVNSLAELCEQVGADIAEVTCAMGLDDRIGTAFLDPGPGWGGSCLPKDTRALLAAAGAAQVDFPLLCAAIDTNEHQPRRVVAKVRDAVGSLEGTRIALLGLAFKAGTNDLRDSPALAVAGLLAAEGADLVAYDPSVSDAPGVAVVDSVREAALGARALVVLTEWPEFAELDWPALVRRMATPVIVDTRNLVPPEKAVEAGFRLVATGRPVPPGP